MSRYYIDRFENTGEKRLLPMNGEVFVKCTVVGRVRGRIKRSIEVGKSGLRSVSSRRKFNDNFIKAQQNAMYQFRTRYGASGERITEIHEWWINYPMINGYRSKRIRRNNKYYTYVFDNKGKIKTYSKWTYVNKDKDITILVEEDEFDTD